LGHLEMRDFKVLPQYDYCAEGLLLHSSATGDADTLGWSLSDMDASLSSTNVSFSSFGDVNQKMSFPRVLIAYGSEMGNAEGVARRLKRQLALLDLRLF